jgi:hypothetical protein
MRASPSAAPPADLSVVIVTHNSEGDIAACLGSLERDCAGLEAEVFVVDSASTDRTVDLIRNRFSAVHLIVAENNVGFSAGNNLALPLCRGRRILLLNPDTLVHEGALKLMLRRLDEQPSAGLVGPTLRLENGEIQTECARHAPRVGNLFPWLLLLDKLEWFVRFRQRPRETTAHPPPGTLLDRFSLLSWTRDTSCAVESISGACMLMRREVFDQVGVLDAAAPLYLDDIDYCRRVRDAGWEIHFLPEATITHRWQRSSSQLSRDGDFYAMGCHSIWMYLRKHDGPLAAAAFALMAAVASPLRLAACRTALVLRPTGRRGFWERQSEMALGLTRWAWRWRKSPPRFGFANESAGPDQPDPLPSGSGS